LYFSEAVLEKSVRKMAVASLFLGLTTLCKPISYYFFFVAIFTLIFYHRKDLPRTPRLTLTIIFIYFLTLFPWLIRNYLDLGYFEFTQYRQTEIFLRRVADNLLNEQKFYYEEPFLKKDFIGVLKIYPEKIIENAFEGFKGSFLPEKKLSKIITCNKDWETSLYDTYVTKGVFQTVFTIFYRGKIGFLQVVLLISQFIFDFGIYFFAFLGFFTFARKKHPFKVLAIFTFVYFSVYACLSEPKPKFRIPFVPVLMICAATGISSLTSQTQKNRK
ncbi:hypothetical protein IT568_04165, partial [bacterium]|nr:hypothetical protein [bacterium]